MIRVDIETIIMAAGPVPSVIVLRERNESVGAGAPPRALSIQTGSFEAAQLRNRGSCYFSPCAEKTGCRRNACPAGQEITGPSSAFGRYLNGRNYAGNGTETA